MMTMWTTAAAAWMPDWQAIGLAVGAFLLLSLLAYILLFVYIGWRVYTGVLRRESPEAWGRAPSAMTPTHLKMDEEGMRWHENNRSHMTPVHIVRDGLNLYGEYYDFGHKRCVIFMSGRTESLRYGYYFVQPYPDEGYNVLVVDPRAHGLSDGKFNTVGYEESKDVLAWARMLHETYGISAIVFHGICIGAAGAMLAMTSPDCPEYLVGMVAEGMFARFKESMRNNLKVRKKPTFPLLWTIELWMRIYTGHSMYRGPLDVIDRYKKPLLMIHSREDQASRPEFAQKLFERCGSTHKRIEWFEHGGHSLLRSIDSERYDNAVRRFLRELNEMI